MAIDSTNDLLSLTKKYRTFLDMRAMWKRIKDVNFQIYTQKTDKDGSPQAVSKYMRQQDLDLIRQAIVRAVANQMQEFKDKLETEGITDLDDVYDIYEPTYVQVARAKNLKMGYSVDVSAKDCDVLGVDEPMYSIGSKIDAITITAADSRYYIPNEGIFVVNKDKWIKLNKTRDATKLGTIMVTKTPKITLNEAKTIATISDLEITQNTVIVATAQPVVVVDEGTDTGTTTDTDTNTDTEAPSEP